MFSQSMFDKIHDRSILEIADKLQIRYHGYTGNFRMCKCFMHDDRHPSATTCLFGLHLLRETSANDDTIVAVVESEKTAVICSELIPAIPSDRHHTNRSNTRLTLLILCSMNRIINRNPLYQ